LPLGGRFVVAVTTPANRDYYLSRAAATLRQYRSTPEPFGNPMPGTKDPDKEEFYYTDFSRRHELRDPQYYFLRNSWNGFSSSHPSVMNLLVSIDKGFGDNKLAGDQGAAWPLGPGLVPKGRNSGPYALIGGEWNERELRQEVFLGERDGLKTLRVPATEDYLFAYWLGRFHNLLGE